MNSQLLERRISQLNERLRILLLQNAREEALYDDRFLRELRQLAEQILNLKQLFNERNSFAVRTFRGQIVV